MPLPNWRLSISMTGMPLPWIMTANLNWPRCLLETKERLTVVTNIPRTLPWYWLAMKVTAFTWRQAVSAGIIKSLIGSMCSQSLEDFRVDKDHIVHWRISIEDGITEYNTEEAILRKMLQIGRTRMILCEFSKFSEVAFNKEIPRRRLIMFTDWNISYKEVKAWVISMCGCWLGDRKYMENNKLSKCGKTVEMLVNHNFQISSCKIEH